MTTIKLTNLFDLERVKEGRLSPNAVRSIELEALVDTGSVELAIPADVAEELDLLEIGQHSITLADGTRRVVPRVAGVLLEVQGQTTGCDAFVLPVGSRPLLGQIPIEGLNMLVDPPSQELRINPEPMRL